MPTEHFVIKSYGYGREVSLSSYTFVSSGNLLLTFETYPAALSHIQTLPNGFYQIDKVFEHIRDGCDDPDAVSYLTV